MRLSHLTQDQSRYLSTVPVAQTRAAAQFKTETSTDKLADQLPVPVGQSGSCFLRRRLNGGFQLGLLFLAQDAGEPPLCSKAKPTGPCWRIFSSHSLIVCRSRSGASATWTAVRPSANSPITGQRSRSRGDGALYTRVRTAFKSPCHWSRCAKMSVVGNPQSKWYLIIHLNSADSTLALV